MRVASTLAGLGAVAALLVVPLGGAATPSGTSLTIRYLADGADPTSAVTWTLRCNPPRGTHPTPAAACRGLARVGRRALAPVPPGLVCTQIYGGPEVAVIKGLVDGQRTWVRLRRTDGCQISRWDRFVPWLLPSGGAIS